MSRNQSILPPGALRGRMAECTVRETDLFYILSQEKMLGWGLGSESMRF